MIQIRRFTLIPFMALLVASLAGCSQQEEDVPQPQEKEDGVTLRLVIDTGAESSRAVAPDHFEAPNGEFEQIYTLRVILVKVTGSESDPDEIEANKLVRTTPTGQPIDDNLEFKVSTGNKKIYLIANEASLSVPNGYGQPNATAFLDDIFRINTPFASTVFDGWMVSLPGNQSDVTQGLYSDVKGAKGLPLTEFFEFQLRATPETQQYDETETVQLFLTRAAAKATFNVVVDNTYKGTGVNVTGIRLNGLNMQQYVFPKKAEYAVKNKDGSVTPLDKEVVTYTGLPQVPQKVDRFITSFETPERHYGVGGASMVMNLAAPIEIKAGNEDTVGPVYFTESLMPVTVAENPAARFSVQVELDGNGNWLEAQPLGVGEYNGVANNILQIDGAQAIARNTHLKITIRFSDSNITATVQLVPYIGVDLHPTFGFDELNPNQNN